jgi:hypothetical protein
MYIRIAAVVFLHDPGFIASDVMTYIFFGRGVVVFLRGILRKQGVSWWFFGGENVVECVVNVVFWQSLFRVGKMCQLA